MKKLCNLCILAYPLHHGLCIICKLFNKRQPILKRFKRWWGDVSAGSLFWIGLIACINMYVLCVNECAVYFCMYPREELLNLLCSFKVPYQLFFVAVGSFLRQSFTVSQFENKKWSTERFAKSFDNNNALSTAIILLSSFLP